MANEMPVVCLPVGDGVNYFLQIAGAAYSREEIMSMIVQLGLIVQQTEAVVPGKRPHLILPNG